MPATTELPASTLTHLQCAICGALHDVALPQTVCTTCGRPLFARYDLERAARTLSRAALASRPWSMWRYAEVMPVVDATFIVTLGEGMTPLLHASRLGSTLGVPQLYVKDEGQNPTGTFKARGLSAAISKAGELGVEHIGMPTAGNAGAAAAAYAARAGMTAHIAMPRDAPPAVIDEVRHFGAEPALVDGLIGDAGKLIALGVREEGWLDLSTLKEPYRVEGKKTMGYELWEQFGGELPQVIVYPTGGGTGLIGMWKAFAELEAMGLTGRDRPQLIAVQAEGCAPIVRAFDDGAERAERWEHAETIAAGMRVPAPFADDLILRAIRESNGSAVAVSDEQMLEAMAELAREEGIDACPEGAATLAGLHSLLDIGRVDPDVRIVLLNTGSGLKHPDLRERVRTAAG